ncbi:hypothetical protein LTS18_003409, partial [Coniosporium uncinatum]
AAQSGGQGEPFYRDIDGFETSLYMTFQHGQNVMAEKWGHRGCNLRAVGLGKDDQWRVHRDWDWWEQHPEELKRAEKEGWPKDKIQ